MCGFAGWFGPPGQYRDTLHAAVGRMANPLPYRRPDDAGRWIQPDAGIALGFRRLVILHRSATGHLPMQSGDGRYIVMPGTCFRMMIDPYLDRPLNQTGLFQWRCQRFTAARGSHRGGRSDRGYRQYLSSRRQLSRRGACAIQPAGVPSARIIDAASFRATPL